MSTRPNISGPALAVSGAALQIGTVVALLRTVPVLHAALSAVTVSGIGDPASLLGAVSEVLAGSAVGLGLGVVGLVLLCASLVAARYRAAWLRCFLSAYGILLLVVLPLGTAFGIFFLVYIRIHRQEFGRASSPFAAN